jgi:hypothetical protein
VTLEKVNLSPSSETGALWRCGYRSEFPGRKATTSTGKNTLDGVHIELLPLEQEISSQR